MDLMDIRRKLLGMQNELPEAYRRVEYLESSGTQYISTGYICGDDFATDCEYSYRNRFSGDNMFFGARQSSPDRACYVEHFNRNNWYCANGRVGYRDVLREVGTDIGVKHTVHMDASILSVDDKSAEPNWHWSATTIPLYIYAWNNNGTAKYFHTALRIHTLKWFEGSKTVANFIPCVRKSDNKPGLYDTVSKTFYTNAGTGEFIVPD